jgi:nitrogen regulatory protein P-II 1
MDYHLLVFVLNREEELEEILLGFVEIGIPGATVLDSVGMGRILSHEIPLFAGLRSLIIGTRPSNKTIFTVIPGREKVDQAIHLIEDICGDLAEPGSGILFSVPLSDVRGVAPAEETLGK